MFCFRISVGLALGLAIASGLQPSRAVAQSQADQRQAAKFPGRSQVEPPPEDQVVQPKRANGLKVSLSTDGQTIYLVGLILDGSFHQVDAVLRSAPKVRRVHLASVGGYTIEARLIAALVRKRKLDTHTEYYCASACTQIFAAGLERTIGPRARLGFHQAILLDPKGGSPVRLPTDRKLSSTTVFGVNGNDTLRLAYELAGIDRAFIDKALTFDHEAMWLPTQEELIAAKVITRLPLSNEPTRGQDGAIVISDIRVLLQKTRFWNAVFAHEPVKSANVLDEIWRSANSGYSLVQAISSGRSRMVAYLSRSLATAPDPLLDRALRFYAQEARRQRGLGYPSCETDDVEGANLLHGNADTVAEAEEDAIFSDMLTSGAHIAAMDAETANSIFTREIVPLLVAVYRTESFSKSSGRCRIGFRTYEAIDGMPAKKRIRAYRALLTLPGPAAED